MQSSGSTRSEPRAPAAGAPLPACPAGGRTAVPAEYVHDQDAPLLLEEALTYRPNRLLLRRLTEAREDCAGRGEPFRVLDFGCGRGQAVAWLRSNGFEADGFEVHEKWVRFAAPALLGLGLHPERVIHFAPQGASADLPAGHYQFVFSISVMEHVEDLDRAVAEIDRLTAPGGRGFHCFIGHRALFEGHLGMPFVHWIPKGEARRRAIGLCLLLGFDPAWRVNTGRTRRERADFYHDFSSRQTFYRPLRRYRRAFERRGQRTEVETLEQLRLRSPLLARLVSSAGLAAAFRAAATTFRVVAFSTRKPGAAREGGT